MSVGPTFLIVVYLWLFLGDDFALFWVMYVCDIASHLVLTFNISMLNFSINLNFIVSHSEFAYGRYMHRKLYIWLLWC
jgi:hypothetical protein